MSSELKVALTVVALGPVVLVRSATPARATDAKWFRLGGSDSYFAIARSRVGMRIAVVVAVAAFVAGVRLL